MANEIIISKEVISAMANTVPRADYDKLKAENAELKRRLEEEK